MIWLRIIIAMLCLLTCPFPASADELRPGVIRLSETSPGSWRLAWKQPLSGPGPAALIPPTVPQNCRLTGPPARRVAPLALLGDAQLVCRGTITGGRVGWGGIAGRGDAILRVAPLGRPVQTFRLTADQPSAVVAAETDRWQVAVTYGRLGVGHILSGWDHLLFVIALVLLVRVPRSAIIAATAFTLAHSLTLAAVTLGFAGLPQDRVEALIALSIVVLAAELARGGPPSLTRRLPWLVAFGFGLLHGFGFADALREIGLPQNEVPTALLAFNLGVEAGQIVVIAAVLGVLWLLRRLGRRGEARALAAASYAIGTIAAFWLIERIVG